MPKKLRSKIKFGQTVFKKLKDNPSLAKKGINELRRNGFNSLNSKMHSAVTVSELTSDYAYQDINLEEIEELKIEIEKFTYRPLISIIIPVYNVEPKWLEIAINSVKSNCIHSGRSAS